MPKKTDKHYDNYVAKKDRQKHLKEQRKTKEAMRDPNLLYEDTASETHQQIE